MRIARCEQLPLELNYLTVENGLSRAWRFDRPRKHVQILPVAHHRCASSKARRVRSRRNSRSLQNRSASATSIKITSLGINEIRAERALHIRLHRWRPSQTV